MPKIVILPHADLCPDGAVLEAKTGETILDVALRAGIEVEHACEKILCLHNDATASCVKVSTLLQRAPKTKTTCWTKAWGLEPDSRLSCQAAVTDEDLVVEFPRYTINHAREH